MNHGSVKMSRIRDGNCDLQQRERERESEREREREREINTVLLFFDREEKGKKI